MRTVHPFRLLLVPAALLAAACDESSNPIAPEEAPAAEAEAPAAGQTTGPLEDLANWADGYLLAASIDGKFTTALGFTYNRSGGAVVVSKVAGTTGRYIARFRNLSGILGGKSTVHVTATGDKLGNHYCKPVGGFLVRDSVEVRCFTVGTGVAVNTDLSLNVLGKRDDRAFAFANQPTAANYAPASAGSWNPAGPVRVYRQSLGSYRVVFTGMGARLPYGVGGHVQVTAVGTGKAHCLTEEWGTTADITIYVVCYTPTGARTDSKFSVFFTPPAAHLAYVWADQPQSSYYNPLETYRSNPVGGAVTISRSGTGQYMVRWIGIEAEIVEHGNVQATAYGFNSAQCKATVYNSESVSVRCFGPSGALIDTHFTVLLGS